MRDIRERVHYWIILHNLMSPSFSLLLQYRKCYFLSPCYLTTLLSPTITSPVCHTSCSCKTRFAGSMTQEPPLSLVLKSCAQLWVTIVSSRVARSIHNRGYVLPFNLHLGSSFGPSDSRYFQPGFVMFTYFQLLKNWRLTTSNWRHLIWVATHRVSQ